MAESPHPPADTGQPDPALPADDLSGASAELAESREQFLLREEAQVGDTALARQINAGLRALARAARSFLLYDPSNEAIRVFLEQYRTDMLGAVEQAVRGGHAEGVELLIRPFELVWETEVVYIERDRERSLAFRMFRDGVRRLMFQPGIEWTELLRLLQILSIRYTGVRQQEDDIVTLLWKAGFQHIEIVAVEGFVPEEEDDDDMSGVADGAVAGQGEERGRRTASKQAASFVDAPPDFDLPIPRPLTPGTLQPVVVPEDELEEVRHEAGSRSLPEQCVRLVSEMVALVAEPSDPTVWSDITHLIDEVRDFLLSEGQLSPLIDLVKSMEHLRNTNPEEVDKLLDGFVDGRALRRIVRSIPAASTRPPEELLWLLDHLPGDHLGHSLEVLGLERGTSARRILRQLVERFIEGAPDTVLTHVETAESAVAADLLRAFCDALPERRIEAVRAAVGRADTDLLFEALKAMEPLDSSQDIAAMLVKLLDSESEEVRLRTLEQVKTRGMGDFFDTIQASLVKRSHGRMSPAEASAMGVTLVALDPMRAVPTLTEWIRPNNLFKRFFGDPIGGKWMQWAAVSGLAQVEGNEHDKVIRWLSERAGSELADHCIRTLARRRREMSGG